MSNQLTVIPPAAAIPSPPAIPAQANSDRDLIELWLRTKRSPKTRKEYRRDVDAFLAWRFVARHYERPEDYQGWLASMRLIDLQDYAESLAGRPANTQRRMLSSLKSLFGFAKSIGYLSFDVAAAISMPRGKNVLAERILSEEQIMTMIVSETNPRNQLLLRFLYVTGARLSEVHGLRWRDLQARETGGQAVLYGKGEKTRVVRLPARLFADLEAIRRPPEMFVFYTTRHNDLNRPLDIVQIWRIVRAAARRAGVTGLVSPHWLRHAHASHALARGANIAIVQETLGHESLQTTSKYTHARPDDSSSLYLAIG